MIVKVCGMRDAENIRMADQLNTIDWMGFIFYPASKRYVGELSPSSLPQHSQRVGVFVNEQIQKVKDQQSKYQLDLIQLHGDESPDYCNQLRVKVGSQVKLIKVIPISTVLDLNHCKAYEDVVDYFLFETRCASYGGSGTSFDWSLLQDYNGQLPFLITGGIGPSDVSKVQSFSHPRFAGIDINSCFEISPALKDIKAISNFINKIKAI